MHLLPKADIIDPSFLDFRADYADRATQLPWPDPHPQAGHGPVKSDGASLIAVQLMDSLGNRHNAWFL